MLRCLALGVALAGPAAADQIAGVLTLPEGADLAAAAELHMIARTADGQTAGMLRQPVQPGDPLSFSLPLADAAGVTLQAAIFQDARPIWLSDAVTVAAEGAMTLPLAPPTLPGGLAPYACGERMLQVAYGPDAARLVDGWAVTDLTALPGSAGFASETQPQARLRVTGNRLAVMLGDTPLPPCLPLMPPPVFPLAASGTNPVWSVVVTRSTMALAWADGTTDLGGAPDARTTADGLVVFAPPDMNLILTAEPCADPGTGAPYPLTAELQMPGTTLTGCAGRPEDALAGQWTIAAIAGTPLPAEPPAALSLDGIGVGATVGCNRLRTTARFAEGGLTFTPVTSTRMACPAALAVRETALADVLPQVTRAVLDPKAGAVRLMGGETALVVLTRLLR